MSDLPEHDMNETEIRNILLDIKRERKIQKKLVKKNLDEFTKSMKEKHKHFFNNFPGLFDKSVKGELNMRMMNIMLSMMTKIQTRQVTEKTASEQIGQLLADKYVNPVIEQTGETEMKVVQKEK